jgi:hypothetical protein
VHSITWSSFLPVSLSGSLPRALKLILAVLFLGPLIAPLFQATRLPLIADSGALARDLLSLYVCPTPAKSYAILGFPMAVCARCWGATIGLWAAALAFQTMQAQAMDDKQWTMVWNWSIVRRLSSMVVSSRNVYLSMSWVLRLAIAALPFVLWVAEINTWPTAPLWVLLLNGAFAGFWAGLFFCSIWPGMRRG